MLQHEPQVRVPSGVKSLVSRETILIIEDEPDIQELLQYNLERDGYKVHSATDGEQGLKLAREIKPQMILLDLMLPGMDGLSICRKLRGSPETERIPIMMLTAKGEESDVVVGLEIGADDYMTKPFSPKELVARIRAVFRRADRGVPPAPETKTQVVEVGTVVLDADRHHVHVGGEMVVLTLAEFRLVETLMSKPGRVFTREQLLERIAGADTYVIDRNVDVHVRSVRKKFGEYADFIQTVRGVGYKCLE